MSIVEQLHQKIEALETWQQEELLNKVDQWLGKDEQPDEQEEEREKLIRAILDKRIAEKEQNRAKSRPFDDVIADLEKQYDWR